MGFRDFKAFNLAMLAKQGWKLLSKSHNLVSRIFKARWSIGDGSNINIMRDPWLRSKEGDYITGPQISGVYDMCVNDLLLHNSKQWDTQAIHALFDHAVTSEIMKVPLLGEVTEDGIIWKEEKNGEYSVRSGYRLWRNSRRHNQVGSGAEVWDNIWNIMAPPRAKHLLWRICRRCLPLRVRLLQHYVQCPSVCQSCEVGVEDD
ncbi:unnamed protein product [Lathyrus sativus]|nr:unnamed protein product [Lathyrus sativus]